MLISNNRIHYSNPCHHLRKETMMIYVYDILINLSKNRIYEFYEWNEDDTILHIKKIPLYKISDNDLDSISNNKVKFDLEFTKSLYNKTEVFKNKNKNLYNYLVLFADNNRALAVQLDNNGEVISKSKMQLDEEEEILELTTRTNESNIKYNILKKEENDKYITRIEEDIKNYLINDLEKSYHENNINKIKFIYNEYFNKKNDNLDKMYIELKKQIKNKDSSKDKELYNMIKLSYTKINNNI